MIGARERPGEAARLQRRGVGEERSRPEEQGEAAERPQRRNPGGRALAVGIGGGAKGGEHERRPRSPRDRVREVEERPGDILLLTQPPKVTIQFTDANVRTVLQLLAAYSGNGSDFEEVLRTQQQLLRQRLMRLSALREHHAAIARIDLLTAKRP